jgi:hypothetical protein
MARADYLADRTDRARTYKTRVEPIGVLAAAGVSRHLPCRLYRLWRNPSTKSLMTLWPAGFSRQALSQRHLLLRLLLELFDCAPF